MTNTQPNPYDRHFCTGDNVILPSRLRFTRVAWCHLVMKICSLVRAKNLNPTAVWQYKSCGTQGCRCDGVLLLKYGACSNTHGLHAILLRVGIMWHMRVWLILLPTQNRKTVILLRKTIINNSLEAFAFCFGCCRWAQYLSWVFHQIIVGAFNRYLFLMKDVFHVSSNICKLWLLLWYLRVPLHQLASPPGFHVAHIPKENFVLLCINVLFWQIGMFSLPAAGLFSCSRLRGMQGARPDTTAQG